MQSSEKSKNGAGRQYQHRIYEIHNAFETGATGRETITACAKAMDQLIGTLWGMTVEDAPQLSTGVSLLAIGGYGREELFPYSDVDLLFLLDNKLAEKDVKDAIRKINQEMWDLGIRISPTTRKMAECEKFNPDVAEFTLSLIDARFVMGDTRLSRRLIDQALPKLLQRDAKSILGGLTKLTQIRHAKYGETLFHLEPNIKDCPGGLRDVHVCRWIATLQNARSEATALSGPNTAGEDDFRQAVEFLYRVRCFLHYRHDRDDNVLNWQAQDAAALAGVGVKRERTLDASVDAAYWMRVYFRNARTIERRVKGMIEPVPVVDNMTSRFRLLKRRKFSKTMGHGYHVERGYIFLDPADGRIDPAHDPDIVLQVFAAAAESGAALGHETEERLAQALPLQSAHMEEGAALWHPFRKILTGRFAGHALRAMHALGFLELFIPEFHGIDALVIRDAYHRYTVDEHTFVLIDTLHELESPQTGPRAEWAAKFSAILRDIPHPELLYLAALMHDTGKGRSSEEHAKESARMARNVLDRLELDTYESDLVLGLIENHLAMSAALRRDIFDAETVHAFAGKVMTPEALRMLTLFTYADINAVHPAALTPWKAENIWRLYIATSNHLDRSVDDERVSAQTESELVHRVAALLPGRRAEVGAFLDGFPERYLLTRTPEQVRLHYEMMMRFGQDTVQLEFHYGVGISEISLMTHDRPELFATMAGALAAWGMNIVTADAFSNRQGIVVDTFRFTDTFRTLEMNVSEHEVFVKSVHDILTGAVSLEKLLSGRRRSRLKMPMVVVGSRVDFDDEASSHSTLLQVVAQDISGLLRVLGLTLAAHGCNIEVALIDTEGETAIDVFYLTKNKLKLKPADARELRQALIEAIAANAG